MGHITIVLKPNLAERLRYYFCLRNNYYMFGSAQVIMYLSHYICIFRKAVSIHLFIATLIGSIGPMLVCTFTYSPFLL